MKAPPPHRRPNHHELQGDPDRARSRRVRAPRGAASPVDLAFGAVVADPGNATFSRVTTETESVGIDAEGSGGEGVGAEFSFVALLGETTTHETQLAPGAIPRGQPPVHRDMSTMKGVLGSWKASLARRCCRASSQV